jgi:NADPH:quinone reductase-like Zn-dependent oxidoreductase
LPKASRTAANARDRRPMRAVVCTDYGPPDVLQVRDVVKPLPKDDEVLVRIRATTASAADCELRRFDFAPWIWLPMRLAFGIRRPRRPVLGQELAGDVESVGKDVGSLKKGDRVFAATGIGLGAYAEYICLRESPQTGAIATMPANLSYEEAAAVPYGGGETLGSSAADRGSWSTEREGASARSRSSSRRSSGRT